MKKRLEDMSFERTSGCQMLNTYKTMLAMSGTRKKMIIQAFNQGEKKRNLVVPKLQYYGSIYISNK
jgi:hypothetical protein